MAWSDYAFNRKVPISLDSAYHRNLTGAFDYDGENVYFALRSQTEGNASKIFTFNKDGTAVPAATLTIPATADPFMTGLRKTDLGHFWVLRHTLVINDRNQFHLYQGGDASELSTFDGPIDYAYGLELEGTTLITISTPFAQSLAKFYTTSGSEVVGSETVLSLDVDTERSLIDGGFCRAGNEYFLLQTGTPNIIAFDADFNRVNANGGTLESTQSHPIGIAESGGEICVYDWGQQHLYFYGEFEGTPGSQPVEPGEDPLQPGNIAPSAVGVRQFRGLEKYTRSYDIVRAGQEGGVIAERILGIDMLAETATQIVDAPDTASLQAYLNTVTFTPRFFLSNIQPGDTIVVGSGADMLAAIPTEARRWVVSGQSNVGTQRQVIYAEDQTTG